jgi:hypothetical protein
VVAYKGYRDERTKDIHRSALLAIEPNEFRSSCKRYGVSRKTYYKWMSRYKQKGIEGLSDISRRKTCIVMESSCVWYNIYSYLSEKKHLNVVLSNPIKTRAIASAKIKTDKLDAVKLANLLRGGYIHENSSLYVSILAILQAVLDYLSRTIKNI